jgi:transposase InsO family protein
VHRTVYPTRKKAQQDIAHYIEIFYNRQRLHSTLGYRTTRGPHRISKQAARRMK